MQTVVIYGNSLVVSSIGASLQGCADLQVVLVDLNAPDAQQCLKALQPDIVIFDLGTVRSDFPVALFKETPHLLLIGVDLTADRALLLSGQPARVLTTEDLLQVIRLNDPGSPGHNRQPCNL